MCAVSVDNMDLYRKMYKKSEKYCAIIQIYARNEKFSTFGLYYKCKGCAERLKQLWDFALTECALLYSKHFVENGTA